MRRDILFLESMDSKESSYYWNSEFLKENLKGFVDLAKMCQKRLVFLHSLVAQLQMDALLCLVMTNN